MRKAEITDFAPTIQDYRQASGQTEAEGLGELAHQCVVG